MRPNTQLPTKTLLARQRICFRLLQGKWEHFGASMHLLLGYAQENFLLPQHNLDLNSP